MATQALLARRAGGHAVVIGGSLAGLVATRVLADHFDQVTLIERDSFPTEPAGRKGVPQARHIHLLLKRGQNILESFFPGYTATLRTAGAIPLDLAGDFAWFGPAGWGIQFVCGMEILSCSRDLLEWQLRQRVAAYPRVAVREAHDVTGLIAEASGRSISGVRVHPRNAGAGAVEEAVAADFIVDASGRHSHTPQWLPVLGYAAPQETVINAFLGYATRVYARPAPPPAAWTSLIVSPDPPRTLRGGIILPVEGDRWFVTLTGMGREYPPTDEDAFLEFARRLPTPAIYDAIKAARPLGPIAGYRATENRLHHYEQLTRWPTNFVVLGDAACAFNPVYGQGMSAAALGGLTLDRCLRAALANGPGTAPTPVAAGFQRQLARGNQDIWLLATGEDFRCPVVEGGQPGVATRLVHRYMNRVIRRATSDEQVRRALLQVIHLLKPATSLFQPWVCIPALLAAPARRTRPGPDRGPG